MVDTSRADRFTKKPKRHPRYEPKPVGPIDGSAQDRVRALKTKAAKPKPSKRVRPGPKPGSAQDRVRVLKAKAAPQPKPSKRVRPGPKPSASAMTHANPNARFKRSAPPAAPAPSKRSRPEGITPYERSRGVSRTRPRVAPSELSRGNPGGNFTQHADAVASRINQAKPSQSRVNRTRPGGKSLGHGLETHHRPAVGTSGTAPAVQPTHKAPMPTRAITPVGGARSLSGPAVHARSTVPVKPPGGAAGIISHGPSGRSPMPKPSKPSRRSRYLGD